MRRPFLQSALAQLRGAKLRSVSSSTATSAAQRARLPVPGQVSRSLPGQHTADRSRCAPDKSGSRLLRGQELPATNASHVVGARRWWRRCSAGPLTRHCALPPKEHPPIDNNLGLGRAIYIGYLGAHRARSNRRKNIYCLTPKGQALVDELDQLFRSAGQ